MSFNFKNIATLIIVITFSLFVGCTKGAKQNRSTAADTTSDTTTDDTTRGDDQELFDTRSDAGSLFDTTSDTVNTDIDTDTTSLDNASAMCVAEPSSNGWSTTNPDTGGWSTSDPNVAACYDTPDSRSREYFYNLTLSKLTAMRDCYEMVAGYDGEASIAVDLPTKFRMGAAALTRCFRRIVQQEMRMFQMSAPQERSYQNSDATLYYLLMMLNNGNGNNDLNIIIPTN